MLDSFRPTRSSPRGEEQTEGLFRAECSRESAAKSCARSGLVGPRLYSKAGCPRRCGPLKVKVSAAASHSSMLTRNPGGAGVDWWTGVVRGGVRSWAIFGNDRSWRAPSARVQACQALEVVHAMLTTQGTHRSQQGIYLICLYCTALYYTVLHCEYHWWQVFRTTPGCPCMWYSTYCTLYSLINHWNHTAHTTLIMIDVMI